MNVLTQLATFFRSDLAETFGWILVHSTWQIILLAGLYWVIRSTTQSALTRYWSGVGLMMCLLISVLVTGLWSYGKSSSASASHQEVAVLEGTNNTFSVGSGRQENEAELSAGESQLPQNGSGDVADLKNSIESIQPEVPVAGASDLEIPDSQAKATDEGRFENAIESALPIVVFLWGLGAIFFATRPVLGTLYSMRVRRQGAFELPDELKNDLVSCVEQFGIKRHVKILQSSLAKIPMVVGYLRPVVLLPVSVVTGFSPKEIEAIVRHELAHVKRHDVLVNMVQSIIETVFFFHPALWWLSNQVRLERENCCDDLATRNQAEAINLANALYRLAESRIGEANTSPASGVIVAATGGDLTARIRRLVIKRQAAESRTVSARIPAMIFIGLIVMALSASVWAHRGTTPTDDRFGKSKEITLKSVGGAFSWNVQKIDEPRKVQQIEKSFPGFRSNARGADPAGYETDLQLIFTDEAGEKIVLGVNTKLGLWNRGNGDYLMSNRLSFLKMLEASSRSKKPSAPKESSENSTVRLKGSIKPVEIQFDETTGSMIFKGDKESVEKLSAMMKRLDELRGQRQSAKKTEGSKAARSPNVNKPHDNRLLLAESNLAKAQVALAHSRKLFEKGFISEQQLRSDEVKLQALRNELEVIKAALLAEEIDKKKAAAAEKAQLDYDRAVLMAQIAAAEAELAYSQSEYERTNQLFKRRLAPKHQLDRLGVDVEKARANLEILRLKLKQISATKETRSTPSSPRRKTTNQPESRNEISKHDVVSNKVKSNPVDSRDPERRNAVQKKSTAIELQIVAAELEYAEAALQISLEKFENLRRGKKEGVHSRQHIAEAELEVKRHEANAKILKLRYQQLKDGGQPTSNSASPKRRNSSQQILRIELDHAKQKLDLRSEQMEILKQQFDVGVATQNELLDAKQSVLKAEMEVRVAETALAQQLALERGSSDRGTQPATPEKRSKSSKSRLPKSKSSNSRLPEAKSRGAQYQRSENRSSGNSAQGNPTATVRKEVPEEKKVERRLNSVDGSVGESSKRRAEQPERNTNPESSEKVQAPSKPDDKDASKKSSNRERYRIFGKVTDENGNALSNVSIRMATGWGTLRGGAETKSDAKGNYELDFDEGVLMKDPALQTAWCFIKHDELIYKENSLKVPLLMAMARTKIAPDDLKAMGFPPNGLIVRGKPGQIDFIMHRPAVLNIKLVDENGKRVDPKQLVVDDTNQTSFARFRQKTGDEDLKVAVALNRSWTVSLPFQPRFRSKSDEINLKVAGDYQVEVMVRDRNKSSQTLTIRKVIRDGADVSDQVILRSVFSESPIRDPKVLNTIDSLLKKAESVNSTWVHADEFKKMDTMNVVFQRGDEEARAVKQTPKQLRPVFVSPLKTVLSRDQNILFHQVRDTGSLFKISYSLPKLFRYSAGNGVQGKYQGYYSTNVIRGTLTIDKKTHQVMQHDLGDITEYFSDFKTLPNQKVLPARVQIVKGGIEFDWRYQVVSGHWLLHKIPNQDLTLTVSVDKNSR